MNLEGIISHIGETITINDKLKKRQLILKTDLDTKYPQEVAIDFLNDKGDILNRHQQGQKVSVSINIRGKKSNGNYYNNIVGWKIAHIISNEVTNQQQNPEREIELEF